MRADMHAKFQGWGRKWALETRKVSCMLGGMDWQQIVALGLVCVTAVIMFWQAVRRRFVAKGSERCWECACGRAGSLPVIVLKARKDGPKEWRFRLR